MAKVSWKPGTFIYPLPAVMVSCGSIENPNVLTIAWTGILNTDPAMVYISVRPNRYSHEIIAKTKEFVINLTTKDLALATDYVGVKSGRDENKFDKMGLTPEKAPNLDAPMIKESPVSIECRVTEIKPLGTHNMFIADVLSINADERYLDENGKLDLEAANLIAYSHGQYYTLGENLGRFGFSVAKK